jgi:hypothetical protein
MDIFFAKFLGLYFVIVGLIVMVRKQSIMPAIRELVKNRPILLLVGVADLAAGLALVITHPTISLSVPGAISLIGWTMIVEGILYLAMPYRMIQKFVAGFNQPAWYVGGGAASVLLGMYLVWYGFGLI